MRHIWNLGLDQAKEDIQWKEKLHEKEHDVDVVAYNEKCVNSRVYIPRLQNLHRSTARLWPDQYDDTTPCRQDSDIERQNNTNVDFLVAKCYPPSGSLVADYKLHAPRRPVQPMSKVDNGNPILLGLKIPNVKVREINSGYNPILHQYEGVPQNPNTKKEVHDMFERERVERQTTYLPSGRRKLQNENQREITATANSVIYGQLGLSPRELPSARKQEQMRTRMRTSQEMLSCITPF